jgi:uncharacterized protein with gpF-like domain
MRHTSARKSCAGNIKINNGAIARGATGETTTTDITLIAIAGTRTTTADDVIVMIATMITDHFLP